MMQGKAQGLGREKEEKEARQRLEAYRRLLGKDSRARALSEGLYQEMAGEGDVPALQTAASFALAPVLCMYVGWVLGEACRRGTERLYFLARDGCYMYQVAKTLCRGYRLPIECRYLYCSRYALRTAGYHLMGKKCLDLICLDGMQVTFSGLVGRAGLGKERVWEAAAIVGWKGDVEKPLGAGQLGKLKDWLYGCREFLGLVWEESERRFPLAAGYLVQEGLAEPVKWALVDSGWTGSMQRSFGQLLGAVGCQAEPEGYYFGMYEYPEGAAREKYHPWLFSPEKGLWRMAHFNNNLFESIFSAPEGMTVGYALRGGKYAPELAPVSEEYRARANACGKYLTGYAERLAAEGNQGAGKAQGTGGAQGAGRSQGTGGTKGAGKAQVMGGIPGDRALASRLLRPLMCRPTYAEAAYFGGCEFWDDIVGMEEGHPIGERHPMGEGYPMEEGRPLAPVQTAGELKEGRMVRRALCRLCGVPGKTVPSAWPEGSAVLSGRKRELWHSQAYRYVLCGKRRWKAKRAANHQEALNPGKAGQ